eukprot:scpid51755/ scgid17629/ Uncharacterized protein K02A2.6
MWGDKAVDIRPFYTQRHELSAADGLLLKDHRLVIPLSLRERTLQLAHSGHQGMTRTKQRLYTNVWWPGMTSAAESLCRQCLSCQANTPTGPYRPESTPTSPSTAPWQRVFVDLYGPLPGGSTLLVAMDQLSRYPVTHVFNSTPATAGVLAVLRSAFAAFGLPEEVVSDNGPQFRSAEFNRFLAQMGIAHRCTPPLWPQANGAVERMNRTIGKVLRAAQLDGRDLRAALDEWLLAYRTTPHPATGLPPATIMFGRSIRDTLPSLCTAPAPDATVTANKEHAFRARQCEAANHHRSAQPASTITLKPGQQVLRKNERQHNKLDSIWDPNPWTVDEMTGSTVVITHPVTGQRVSRHVSFMKPAPAIVVHPPSPEPPLPTPPPPPTTPPLPHRRRQQPPRSAKAVHKYVQTARAT